MMSISKSKSKLKSSQLRELKIGDMSSHYDSMIHLFTCSSGLGIIIDRDDEPEIPERAHECSTAEETCHKKICPGLQGCVMFHILLHEVKGVVILSDDSKFSIALKVSSMRRYGVRCRENALRFLSKGTNHAKDHQDLGQCTKLADDWLVFESFADSSLASDLKESLKRKSQTYLYLPRMKIILRTICFIIYFLALVIGFYDVHKKFPPLRAIMSSIQSTFRVNHENALSILYVHLLEWIDTTSTTKYLVAMLIMQICGIEFIITFTSSIMQSIIGKSIWPFHVNLCPSGEYFNIFSLKLFLLTMCNLRWQLTLLNAIIWVTWCI